MDPQAPDELTPECEDQYRQMDASEWVEEAMVEYAKHTRQYQLPSPIDGLKIIHRRILWVMHKIIRDTKMLSVVADVNKLHPYGNASIEKAVARLCQWFSNVHPMIEGTGNLGTYSGEEAAAARYPDMRRSEFAMDMYFTGVNTATFDYIPTEIIDEDHRVEPACFIPVIPMALLTSVFGIAIGFRPNIFPREFKAVCNLAIQFVQNKVNPSSSLHFRPKDLTYYLPDSLVPGLIVNYRELMALAAKGVFSHVTVYDGTMTITPTSIIVHTLPFGVFPQGLLKTLQQTLCTKNSELSQVVQRIDDSTKRLLHYEFVLKRGVDPFHALALIKKLVGFRSVQHPSMVWTNPKGELVEADVNDILEMWYQYRYRSVLADIKHSQTRLILELSQIEAKCIVVENADEALRIIRAAKHRREATINLYHAFHNRPGVKSITISQAEYLVSLQLHQLTNQGLEELLAQRKKVHDKLTALRLRFSKVNDEIIEAIEKVRDKYPIPRKARFPFFMGYVSTNTGVIQFWDESELHALLLSFGELIDVTLYPKGQIWKYAVNGSRLEDEQKLALPKEFSCDKFLATNRKLHTTVCINRQGNPTIYRLLGKLNVQPIENEDVYLVGDQFFAIHVNGTTELVTTTSVKTRTNRGSLGVNTDIIYASPVIDNDLIVAYGSTDVPNEVRLMRVKPGVKLIKDPRSAPVILGVYEAGTRFILNVPSCLLSRTKFKHLLVNNANNLLGDRLYLRLLLSKQRTETGVAFKKTKHGLLSI